MKDLEEKGEAVVLELCGLTRLSGSWLLRDWWRDNRAGGAVTELAGGQEDARPQHLADSRP